MDENINSGCSTDESKDGKSSMEEPTSVNEENNPIPSRLDSTAAGSNVEAVYIDIVEGNEAANLRNTGSNNIIKCDICSCEMSSDVVLTSHINGSRHRKRLKALEIVANLKALGEVGVDIGPEHSPNAYRCDLCSLTVNSPQQLELHLAGAKHKNKIAKEKLLNLTDNMNTSDTQVDKGPFENAEIPPSKKRKREEKSLVCDLCNIVVNSETQYEQHIYSKKHLNRTKNENCVKKRFGRVENKPDFAQNLQDGQQLCSRKDSRRSTNNVDSDDRKPDNDASGMIPVHSPNSISNKTFNHAKSEGVNSGSFNNYVPLSRHFMNNNRKLDGKVGGVGLYELGRFFSKPRSNFLNSGQSVTQTSSKS